MTNNKKTKNLISLAILLAGLFLGSLFVDIGQIVKGNGYSQKNLNKSDIFEASGKTWVAFSEPAIFLSVVNDDECEKCNPNEVLVWLRKIMPTVSAKKINFNSEEGKKMIADFEIKTLPAFVFEKEIDKTDFFVQAEKIFQAKNDKYVLNTQALGAPVGKYVQLPKINESDASFGKKDAEVKVVVFSDLQSPNSKDFYKIFRETMKNYEDKANFVFKELASNDQPQSMSATLSVECALEQGKFWEYADNLFEKQTEWSVKKDTAIFKTYARNLKLNTADFNKCLDEKKFQEKIDANKKEMEDIGIIGTPTVFVNDKFMSGVVDAEQFKKDIEEEINK